MRTPLSVACVHVSSSLGGSERVLLDFAARAGRHDIAAHVLLPKPGPLVDLLRAEGVAVSTAPASDDFLGLSQRRGLSPAQLARFGLGLWKWSRAIEADLERLAREPGGRPAVLYSNGFKAHLACALLPRYRHVWHLHEFPPAGLGTVWKAAALLPTAVIANSRAVARAWTGLVGPTPVVVANGVDLTRFAPSPRTHWIHDQLDLPRDARLIGMPAVFARWKGHLQVVEAFERAAARLEDVHLVLVGGPIYDTVAERGYAEELVRRVGRSSLGGTPRAPSLTDRIHFLRFQSEPWRLYPEFDVVVHFSTRPEPFGRVVVEAMACGTPVIAAREGGPVEIVEDGVSGWLTTPGDTATLANAMVTAMGADVCALGTAARHRAEALFSADRFALEVAEVLHGARAGAPHRSGG